jgi:pimeloyl-ACP methyl ester carboxylesterase
LLTLRDDGSLGDEATLRRRRRSCCSRGATTMLSWPDALCAPLARGGRHVVRYDLRDSGASKTVSPEAPAYTLRDLAADAAALARELDDRPAHLAGIGVGGMVAQVAALDHPDAFSALTLAGTRPVAPGRLDKGPA